MQLEQFVFDFAAAMKAVDATRPVAQSARGDKSYQAGIGPHTETRTVELVMGHLAAVAPGAYAGCHALEQAYPNSARSKVDICLGTAPRWLLSIEVKMLRIMGDNGKPNDNILMHILSPYPAHRSALTDADKLARSSLPGEKAIVIYSYEYPLWPSAPAIEAFEVLAARSVSLTRVKPAVVEGLVHPVHRAATVYGWEVRPR
jgi:hypothetical protein